MSDVQLYRCTPRQTYSHMRRALAAGLVPNLISSPGLGKSSLFRKLAKEFNLQLIDHRLSTSQPEDLSGLPEFVDTPYGRRVATFTPFDIFPSKDTPIPEGKDGWLLFYDEFNSGTKEVQAACYKVILDKYVGQTPLHDLVAQGAAGNLMTDRAITNDLSTAMQSRMIHIEMELSHVEWMEDVAIAEDYDHRIIAYHNYDKDALFDFRPEHQDRTFCCPRTWEFMNKLVKDPITGEPLEIKVEETSLYAGTITSGFAAAFVQFCQVYKELMTVKDVLRDPANAPIPGRGEIDKSFALVSHLMKEINEENFTDICTYINRMQLTFRVLFFRGTLARNQKLRHHPDYAKAMLELRRYLSNEEEAPLPM